MDGVEIGIYKQMSSYVASVHGAFLGRYTSKEAARKQVMDDFRKAREQVDIDSYRKRMEAVRAAGGTVSPQKYAAIERRILRESQRK